MKQNKHALARIYLFVVINFVSFFNMQLVAQEKSNVQEYYIPIVNYEPYNFNTSVRDAFQRLPNTDYLRITQDKDSIKCYINQGLETFQSIFTELGPGEKEIDLSSSYISIEGIVSSLAKDSLFIVNLEPGDRYSRHQNLFPLLFFGTITPKGMVYYRNEKDWKEYSLTEIITMKYGSIKNYKERLLMKIAYYIDLNVYNGIYDTDRKSAIEFLRNDFVFYWEFFPEDKEYTLNLFFNFLDKHIDCSVDLKEQMAKEIDDLIVPIREIKYPPYNSPNIEVLGKDITNIMEKLLSREQFDYIKSKIRVNNQLKYEYMNGPLRKQVDISFEKISNNKTTSVFVWNNSWARNDLIEIEGEYRLLSNKEEKERLQKIIFDK